MNWTCFRLFVMKSWKHGKFFIVSVSILSLVCSGYRASGDQSSDISDILTVVNAINTHSYVYQQTTALALNGVSEDTADMRSRVRNIQQILWGDNTSNPSVSYQSKDNVMYYLRALLLAMYGTDRPTISTMHDSLLGVLRDLSISNAVVSSSVANGLGQLSVSISNALSSSGSAQDILAGNPWWSTNSTFAPYWDSWRRKPEVPSPRFYNTEVKLTFPEILSSMLNQTVVGYEWNGDAIESFEDYFNAYGADPDYSANNWNGHGLTWYDWIADALKSNFVSSATYNDLLLTALAGISNSVSVSLSSRPSLSLTNSVVVNPSELGENPWWYTNSTFVSQLGPLYQGSFGPTPSDDPSLWVSGMSFPEIFSLFVALRTMGMETPDGWSLLPNDFNERWGYNGWNRKAVGMWSFEDWLADCLRSNLYSRSYADLTNEIASSDPGDDYVTTNAPLPAFEDLIAEGDTSSLQASMEGGGGSFESTANTLKNMIGTGGSANIVVIPEFTVGGIHVGEYTASLDTPITPICHAIMVFIWYVSLFAALFGLASAEWAFYANLGRTWTNAGGFHERAAP